MKGRCKIRSPKRKWSLSAGAAAGLAAALVLLSFQAATAQDIVRHGEKLSLDRCVQIALERLPAILAARAAAEVDRNVVREAESAFYPQVGWSASIGRASVGPRTSLGIQTDAVTYNSYSTGLTLSQNIYDFGRTSGQVRIDKLSYSAALADVETASQQAVFDVKQSFYGVLQAERNRDVAEEAVRQYELRLEQARGLFEVGLQPKYDVTKASVDLGNARVSLINARNAVRLALAALNGAMGLTGHIDYGVEGDLAFAAYGLTLEEALAQAYKNRPDLAALATRREAAEKAVARVRAGFFPALSGAASYDYSGNAFPLSRGWSLSLNLGLSLFSGFQTKAQVDEARANIEVLRAGEEAGRQAVYLAVQKAYLDLKQAEEVVPVAELNVTAAQENYDIASGSYKEGVGDPIQVADASAALISAKTAYIQALADCKVYRASLELAMGLR